MTAKKNTKKQNKVNLDKIQYIGAGYFKLVMSEDNTWDDVTKEGAFLCKKSKDCGIKKDDVVLCIKDKEAKNIVVC